VPRHFSKEEKEYIRSQLVQVGLELFEKFGVDKTNIGDITDKVGVAKGSFYNFYNSKGDLFMEIYSIERQKVQDRAVKEFRDSDAEIDVLVKGYAKYLYDAIKERPILNIVYDSNALALISDKAVRDRVMKYNQLVNHQMTEMIQGWFDARGHFAVDARIVTSMIRSLNFLQFHDFAIGYDIYVQTVDAMTDAIAQYVKISKSSD